MNVITIITPTSGLIDSPYFIKLYPTYFFINQTQKLQLIYVLLVNLVYKLYFIGNNRAFFYERTISNQSN